MHEDNRRRLEELSNRLDAVLSGHSHQAELAELLALADGFTGVLLAEVEQERGRRGCLGDSPPCADGPT